MTGNPPRSALDGPTQDARHFLIVSFRDYFFLVPRLRLGTHIFRALPGNYLDFRSIMEAEPPGYAFPGGAWEREVTCYVIAVGPASLPANYGKSSQT